MRHALLLCGSLLCGSLLSLAPQVADAQEPVRREGDLVYFNLQNVELRSALESISEVLGINYVMGGNVPNTTIVVRTARGIPIEEVPDLLDSVLRTYNLALVRTGDVFTVIQAQNAGAGLPGAPGTGGPRRTEVYVVYLRNASAVELANVLTQLFQGGGSAPYSSREVESRALSRTLDRQQLDAEPPVDLPQGPVVIQPSGEAGVQPLPPSFRSAVISGDLIGATTIVPDEQTNSLVIRTAPENYPSIEETIRKLDVRPLQVLIEVTIAEITLDKSTQFGIEFAITQTDLIGDDDTRTEIELEGEAIEGGLRVRVFDRDDVDATLRALAADARVNVLSTPRILSINNQEARILVGSEVPFVQFQRSTIGESVDRVVQFRNVGLELSVTPRINPDRYVTLDLLQQVSSLTADVLFDAPIITTREAETSLVVGDRHTVVLGGLIEDRKERRKSGIPLLRDIPVLGFLFGSRSTRTVKTELVITLTPYIVGSDLELQNLGNEIESGTEFYKEDLEERRREGRPVPGRPGAEGRGDDDADASDARQRQEVDTAGDGEAVPPPPGEALIPPPSGEVEPLQPPVAPAPPRSAPPQTEAAEPPEQTEQTP